MMRPTSCIGFVALCLWLHLPTMAQKNEGLTLEAPKKVVQKTTLNYVVKNSTKHNFYIFEPAQVVIERQEAKQWIPVVISFCPCGSTCPDPPAIKEIDQNEQIKYAWNLQETLCQNGKDIIKEVPIGIYRIIVYYGNNPNDQRRIISQKFRIVKK